MKKKLLVVLLAALLLLTAVACGNDKPGENTGDESGIQIPLNTGDVIVGTDENGNTVTTPVETNPPADISETNPTFTDINKTLYVWYAVVTVRSSTVTTEENGVAWPKEGTTLTATGESANWYRIEYEGETCYIAKSVVGDYAKIQEMTAVDNEEIEISADVNVRTFPSTEGGELTRRGTLTKGTKVTRVAKGDTWSCILYTVVSETETTADGKPVEEVKQYFIFNECIKEAEAEGTAAETVTEEVKA